MSTCRGSRLPGGRLHLTDSLVGEAPSWSPDGAFLAFKQTRDDPRLGNRDLVIWASDKGGERKFSPSESIGDRRPAWFPDGSVQLMMNGTLRVRLENGAFREIHTAHPVPLGVVSPDGKTVYASMRADQTAPSGTIVAYDVETGQPRQRYPLPEGAGDIGNRPGYLALSPDGQTIAVTTEGHGKGARIARTRVDGSDYRQLYTGSIPGPGVAWSADGGSILFLESDGRQTRLMRIPATGGVAERVGIEVEGFSGFDVSRDGKHIAYSTRSDAQEIWALDLPSLPKK